jgi:hypothetical protein
VAGALPDIWDAKLTAWILHWDFHQLFREPLSLFDANIFWPSRYSLAFSENLVGVSLFAFPLYAAGVSTLAAYNVVFLLGMGLSALAAWALAREWTGDPAASLLAGVVYAFLPWRISHLPHVQFQWGAFLALALLFLLRYLERGRRADLVLFGASLAWNALCNVHYAVFSAVLVGIVLAWERLTGTAPPSQRIRSALLVAVAVAFLVSPLFVPYQKASRLYHMRRHFAEIEAFSARPDDFLSAGYRNVVYGPATQKWSHPEGDLFPGVLPLALCAVAVTRLRRRRPEVAEPRPSISRGRGAAVRVLDGLSAGILLLGVCAAVRPDFRLGPLHMADSGRVLLLAAGLFVLRLLLAFPRTSRDPDLPAFLRRLPIDRRATLLIAIGVAGIVLALGAHTPVYRFLFTAVSPVFRSIRAPARFIVLFHLSLAVLAAWGLSLLAGRAPSRRRSLVLTGGLLVTAVEYRAFPLRLDAVSAEAPPVYRWLGRDAVPPGIMEWPLGLDYDFEYEFRSTAHWKPIVNGASGFVPRPHEALRTLVAQDPIPDAIWDRAREVQASLVVFHPHDAPAPILERYCYLLRRGLAAGKLEVIDALPHGRDTDFVFVLASAAPRPPLSPPEGRRRAAELFERVSLRPGADTLAPFGYLDYPSPDLEVEPGPYAHGWAADNSGIQEIRVASELGPIGLAVYGAPRPDIGKVLPNIADSARSGFYFPIPSLPPGPHTLIVTIVGRDGSTTVLRRPIRLLPARAAAPTPPR